MQPIRQILNDAPDVIPIPAELRHQRLEVIFWPLSETPEKPPVSASASIIDDIKNLVSGCEPVELGDFQLNLADFKFARSDQRDFGIGNGN